MQRDVFRLVLAGTNSGCGKTTVTCAVLQALVSRGLRVGAAKCGPDYIDPMFHSRVIGAKSSNLDSFFFDRDTMRYLLAHNGQDCDITVIEGVMGYYDGLGLTSTRASTYEAARETESPVVLVVNARGAALSVVAAVQGFLDFAPDNNVQGVILNGCSAMSYGALARELESRLGVRACGYLPRLPECTLESRHLGLVTADEVADLREKLRQLAEAAEKTLELDALLEIAHNAPVLDFTPPVLPEKGAPVRIGVARDRAFCFYYEDSLDLLRQLGAELIPFSPLADEKLPDGVQGLYLGGGYPELYAARLEENHTLRRQIRDVVYAGMPCIAECGGFTDVSASAYYASAVAWASQNGIVEGFEDGSFQPDAAITREQLAAVLYRCAAWKGADTSASGELTDFADAASVSSGAQAAMKWAVGAGILSGSATGLEPQGTATRAQAAAMLVRFTQTVSQ